MHCAAGDGLGIIAGAAIAAHWHLPAWGDLSLEYGLGFGFGWTVFQAFAMREMAGGSYRRSLQMTFLPEFLSMNLLMAGMVMTGHALMPRVTGSAAPLAAGFWFVVSMALIAGFIFAYPMNVAAGDEGSQTRHDHGAVCRAANAALAAGDMSMRRPPPGTADTSRRPARRSPRKPA